MCIIIIVIIIIIININIIIIIIIINNWLEPLDWRIRDSAIHIIKLPNPKL